MNIDRHFFFAPRFNFVWGMGMMYTGQFIAAREWLAVLAVVFITAVVSACGEQWAEGKWR